MRTSTGLTQVERRVATRTAIIDAAVESLVAHGISGTSTRAVAQAAEISQGALQHHFATKVDLVDAALSSSLTTALADILRIPTVADESERAIVLLDQLWAFHRLPIFGAVFELLAIAQRDPQIVDKVAATLDRLLEHIGIVAAQWLPVAAGERGFSARLSATISATRGAAAIQDIPSPRATATGWPQLRPVLVDVLLGR